MSMLQSTYLEERGLLNDQSSAIQIQGKWFKPGPAFTKSLLAIALEFCKDAQKQGRQYLLIEFPTYFMAWRRIRPIITTPQSAQKTRSGSLIQDQTRSLSPSRKRSAPPQSHAPQSHAIDHPERSVNVKNTSINPTFINQCKTTLAFYIGPMADLLTDQILKQSPHLTPSQLIEALAQQIPDPKAALGFRQELE